MTKFEANEMRFQYGSKNAKEAKRNLRKSCNKCATQGKYISCEGCAIANAHNDVMNFVLR